MISYNSAKNYCLINLTIHTISYINFIFVSNFNYSYLASFLGFFLLTIFITNIIKTTSKDKKFYLEGENRTEFNLVEYVKTIGVNSFSYYLIVNKLCYESQNMSADIIYFIPKSFIYELIFDFGHYWAHRILHTNPILYRYIHKKHHSNKLINIYTSFDHTVADYLITNTTPLYLTTYIFPMSKYQFTAQFIYKTFTEISGHSGKVNASTSFPQLMWFPRFFRIELSNKDHHNHHINPMCNFSKRFSLWDKVFNTYQSDNNKEN
jgi:sterol desaturase/sphingolipid hydroxylase (fatty acid hydroxylase superfamily)